MRRDILNKVNAFYRERKAQYDAMKSDAINRAKEDDNIRGMLERINEIKVLAITGKLTPDVDKEYADLIKNCKVAMKPYAPHIKYECDICKDTGMHNGKYCTCFKRRYNEELKKIANVGGLPSFTFEDANIAQFDIDDRSKALYKLIYEKMQLFTAKYPDVKNANVLITGPVGCGKSCLVSAMAHALLGRGVNVEYFTAFDLGELMLASHLDYKNRSLDTLTDSEVLIIDDLGTEPMRKNINATYLQSILDSRLARKKCTIVTTNLNAEQLMNRYGERIVSRLRDNAISLSLDALPNLRLTNKK